MADIEKSAASPKASGRWRPVRLLAAATISALSLALLIRLVDRASLDAAIRTLSPSSIGLASALFLLSIVIRGYWLRLLAPPGSARTGLTPWVRLAAAHQFAFMLLPSGAGDLGFPVLAGRLTGVGIAPALRMILCYRLQDLWVLAVLGSSALAIVGFAAEASPFLLGVPLLAVPALVWSSDLARLGVLVLARLLHLAARFLRGERFSRLVAAADRWSSELTAAMDAGLRFRAALACATAWGATCAYVWVLFAMVGIVLSAVEVVAVVAGLNLAGALASFSIAGIGVSEGGLAAVLVLLGFHTQDALSTALVVRPIILLNALLVCGLFEGGFRLVRLLAVPTRRTVGTAAGQGRSS